ncbi:KGG domain-containing protein [Chitinophagaceae bacterium LB-8]|uniref:KGG domain-containing protein n=1 Tax=Paraflavisolibacter caeni TaxID=2982496 RepID=A0A9X3B779_9BACT|nr:KGG domain-containing protein [Paraflavisolibacter caeni]MCU7548915.1 KGG domain-containing protein [Paraflavisolibacter caeni]
MAEDRLDNSPQESSMREPSSRGNTSRRGFASMDPQKQRSIASEGGRAAHRQGVAHEWNSDEAREAGRKGGQNSHGGGRNRGSSRVTSENRGNMELSNEEGIM